MNSSRTASPSSYSRAPNRLGLFVAPFLGGRAAIGVLILRAIIGVAFMFHGYPKLEHPTTWMAHMPLSAFVPAWLQAVVAVVEFFGGLFLTLGLLTPLVTALIFCDMFVALFFVQLPRGAHFVGGRNSYELTAVYLVAMIAFFLTGPGAISVDRWLARRSPTR